MQCAFVIFAMYLTRSCGNWNINDGRRWGCKSSMYLTRSCGNWNDVPATILNIMFWCILPAAAGIETFQSAMLFWFGLCILPAAAGIETSNCFTISPDSTECILPAAAGIETGLQTLNWPSRSDVSYPQLRELKHGAAYTSGAFGLCILPATVGIETD